jgi:hypothetical protein
MSEPLTQTLTVTVEKDITDLEMCILMLRNIAKNYPRHFDIAIEALQAEYRLPQMQAVISEDRP